MPYGKVVRAIYTYEAGAPDELSFDEDDLLWVDEGQQQNDDSWLAGGTIAGDKTGLIPANYVEPVAKLVSPHPLSNL